MASVVRPLQMLTKKNVNFEWSSECEEAWMDLKEVLTSDTVMAYFYPKLGTEFIVD